MLDYLGFPDTQEDVDKLMSIVDRVAVHSSGLPVPWLTATKYHSRMMCHTWPDIIFNAEWRGKVAT